MNNDYCPIDCPHLVPTELEQNMIRAEFGEIIKHKCTKYNQYLYHFLAEPDLYKCDECYREGVRENGN